MMKNTNTSRSYYDPLKKTTSFSLCRLSILITNFIVEAMVWFIKFYQRFISPHTLPSCRFLPTCSEYTISALKQKGLWKGTWLSVKRLVSCHPFRPSSVDEV